MGKLIMKEFLIGVVLIIVATILAYPIKNANAGVLDAITGHIDDIKSRFDKDRLTLDKVEVLKSGWIDRDAPGQDPIHNSSGSISIVKSEGKYYLYLAENFRSSLGPDYHVYVSYEEAIIDESGFSNDTQIELGKLKYGSGKQYYELPETIDVDKISSFLLWCKQFGAYIGSANLS